ncbi:hypothetical protein [Streptomyces sp. NPDC058411]|uniref:hypothetical protein n=1 Tax=Streptomyces sp. NPDC058411 TaxID=3346485 RepID=UPI003646AC9E
MAQVLNAEVVAPEQADLAELAGADLVGFGSGVFYGRLHPRLTGFVEALPAGRSSSPPAGFPSSRRRPSPAPWSSSSRAGASRWTGASPAGRSIPGRPSNSSAGSTDSGRTPGTWLQRRRSPDGSGVGGGRFPDLCRPGKGARGVPVSKVAMYKRRTSGFESRAQAPARQAVGRRGVRENGRQMFTAPGPQTRRRIRNGAWVEGWPPASGPPLGRNHVGWAGSAEAATGPSGERQFYVSMDRRVALLPSDSLLLELHRPCAGGTARMALITGRWSTPSSGSTGPELRG